MERQLRELATKPVPKPYQNEPMLRIVVIWEKISIKIQHEINDEKIKARQKRIHEILEEDQPRGFWSYQGHEHEK
jgi:hypothetical protein